MFRVVSIMETETMAWDEGMRRSGEGRGSQSEDMFAVDIIEVLGGGNCCGE